MSSPSSSSVLTDPPVNHSTASHAEIFIIQLGEALHHAGAPVYRIDESMVAVAQSMGLQAQFLSTPTSITAAFGPYAKQRSYLVRVSPEDVHLAKLALLDEVTRDVIHKRITPSEGTQAIERVMSAPPPSGWRLVLPGYAVASAAFAFMVGGSWHDLWISGVVGLIIGVLAYVTSPTTQPASQGLQQIFELLAAIAASFVAHVLTPFAPSSSAYVVTVAGLIVLIPGLSLTVAMMEIATLNLVAGTARLMGASLTFLKLGFGVALGAHMASWLMPGVPGLPGSHFIFVLPPSTIPPAWMIVVTVPLAATAFTAILQARWRDWIWIVLVSAVAITGTRLGTHMLGASMAPLLSAFLVTAFSNMYSRWLHRFAMITLVPGLMLQVPGSLAYRSVSELFHQEVVSGVETAFTVMSIAVAMVAGMLFANAAVSPRRRIHPSDV